MESSVPEIVCRSVGALRILVHFLWCVTYMKKFWVTSGQGHFRNGCDTHNVIDLFLTGGALRISPKINPIVTFLVCVRMDGR